MKLSGYEQLGYYTLKQVENGTFVGEACLSAGFTKQIFYR